MSGDWLALRADYFESVGREVFEEYLRGHGFAAGRADETGSLGYDRGDCRLRLHYYVEERPRYSPMVSIGLPGGAASRLHEIGLWYAVPQGSGVRDYGLWLFSDAEELRRALTRIRDEVVEVYARPLWENPERLAGLIERREREYMAEQRAEASGRRRVEAEQAFKSHDYRRAAAIYGQMDESELSPAERKRYEMSKRHLT
jgi:hypothetical protein